MKTRYVFRATAFLFALSVGLTLAVGTAFFVFPGEVFRAAAAAAQRAGVTVSLPGVRGNPLAGWLFDNLSVEADGFSVSARRLYVDVDWHSLLAGRPAFDAIWADGLAIDVRPSDKPVEKKAGDKPVSLPGIHDLKVIDGRFALRPSTGDAVDVRRVAIDGQVLPTGVSLSRFSLRAFENDIAGRGDFDLLTRKGFVEAGAAGCLRWPGVTWLEERCITAASARVGLNGDVVIVERVSASVSASTITAVGRFDMAKAAGKFHVTSRGPFAVSADAEGDRAGWTVKGEAKAKENALSFDGAVRFDAVPSYNLNVQAKDVPAKLVPGLPPALGTLSGNVVATGRGKKPADLDGRASVRLAASNGPSLTGHVAVKEGAATAVVAVSSRGVGGKIIVAWDIGREEGKVDAKLTLDGKGLQPWAGVAADGTVDVTLRGRMPNVAWTANVDLKKIVSGETSITHATLTGSGKRLSPPAGKLTLKVESLRQGDLLVDSARVDFDGSAARHTVEVAADSQGRLVKGVARGALQGGRWTSTWTSFEIKLGDIWTSRQPFSLDAGAGGVVARELRLGSGEARVAVDGGVGHGRFQDLRVRADGVEIAPLAKAFQSDFDVAGAASLTASASGPLSAPEAQIKASVERFSVSGKDAGTLVAEGRVADRRIYADRVTLSGPAGRLEASGSMPLSFGGKRAPPVNFRLVTTGLDPSALPLPEGIHFEKARVDGDLRVTAGPGIFSAEGRLSFVAAKFQMEDQGLKLSDVDIRLSAAGDELKIVRGVLRTGKKGTLSLDGTVGARQVGIALRARGFEMDHPAGIFVRTDADLALAGTWDAPRVTGVVDIQKADIVPGKAKKKKKDEKEKTPASAPGRSEPTEESPVSADVRIVFTNNVWYKDGQSAVEFKGDVNVRKDSGQPLRLYGSIETVRGEYIFYGRGFAVENGKVSFLGQSPPDPQLDILATYIAPASNVKVHLMGKGTLARPEISLTSEPPLEETDIVSVLVTGYPRGQGGSGAGSEEQARLMAANFLAEKLRSKLQNRIAVDQLKFNLTEGGAAEVTVGQNVTKDLYASYGQTLGAEGERRLAAEYTLTPRWSLNGTTSSVGRYVIDLLFRFGFK